jgi:hypothetical protein
MGKTSRLKTPSYSQVSSPLDAMASMYSERQRSRAKPVPAPKRVKVKKPTKTSAGRAVRSTLGKVTSPLTRRAPASRASTRYGVQNRIRTY